MSAFWDTWRKEIIRGAALFCAVLAIGLFVHYAVGRVRTGVVHDLPMALRDLRSEFARDDGGPGRLAGAPWTYRAKLGANQWLWIRNTRGSVTVEPSRGDSLQISAVKTYRSSDSASVRLVAVPVEGGVTVCAMWGSDSDCGPGHHDIRMRGGRHNDVAVDFTVRLPRSAGLDATTTVGDVDVVTARGPVKVELVNGDVRVRMEAFGDTGGVTASTINGSLTAELPAHLDANVEASTVNGSITTDYQLPVNGKFAGRHVNGTLGRGGRKVHLETVNGSIKLKKAV